MSKKPKEKLNKEEKSKSLNSDKLYQLRSAITKYQHWIVIGEVVVIVLIGYFFILAPKISTVIDSATKNINFWQEQLETAKTNNASAKKLVSLYEGLDSQEREKLIKILPSTAEVPELMSQLESLFESENIFMSDFLVSKLDLGEGDTAPFSIIQTQILFTRPDNYQSYRNVLDKLEKNVRILNIQGIEYSEELDQFTISAFVYFLND